MQRWRKFRKAQHLIRVLKLRSRPDHKKEGGAALGMRRAARPKSAA
jgi:hypothetical protein